MTEDEYCKRLRDLQQRTIGARIALAEVQKVYDECFSAELDLMDAWNDQQRKDTP